MTAPLVDHLRVPELLEAADLRYASAARVRQIRFPVGTASAADGRRHTTSEERP
ncbi:hypothetical protein [Modestobacter marinus]|uniref:hypothetical protein n=1 Tax=Modestobacter marinus TaxID=477641 RepID=UPI001C97CB37|nr:hypothetical protein [Modestobacter marinus]